LDYENVIPVVIGVDIIGFYILNLRLNQEKILFVTNVE